jgi:hypothetical protein
MTMWRIALAWSRNSATHLWANVVILVSAGLEAAAELGDQIAELAAELAGDPELKAQVLALVPHEHVPLVIIAIMIVTKMARNRTLC